MTLLKIFLKFQENRGRRHTLKILRALPAKQLDDLGISPALLDDGISAWPWREQGECQRWYQGTVRTVPNDAAPNSETEADTTIRVAA